LSAKQIRTMVDRGQLHQIHQGIYVYGHPDLPWQGSYLAAQYMAGEEAYLTHGSGLAVARLWRPYTRTIHVATSTGRRSRDGVVIHRTKVPPQPDEIRSDGPLRYAVLPRLLIELAPTSNPAQLTRLITKSVQQNKLDHALMRRILERHAGRPGAALVGDAYAGYLPRPSAKSELEARFDRELNGRPWIPDPERNVYIEAGGIRWEVDRFWPRYDVGVEVDGRSYHEALVDRDKDELKRAKLLTIGIQTLHISDWRIEYGISDALDDLEQIIALRHARAPQPGAPRPACAPGSPPAAAARSARARPGQPAASRHGRRAGPESP
jgi:hypothetical protein